MPRPCAGARNNGALTLAKLLILAASVLLFCVPAAQAQCTNGVVYDANTGGYISYPDSSCPPGKIGSRGILVQLFEPPEYPYRYSHVCIAIWSKENQTTELEARVVAYDAIDGTELNPLTKSLVPQPALSPFYNRTFFGDYPPGAYWITVTTDIIVTHNRVFIGVEFADCDHDFGGVADPDSNIATPQYHFLRRFETDTWEFQFTNFNPYYGPTYVALIRAIGVPYTYIPGWTCDRGLYQDGMTCDCECGLPDPDCYNLAIGPYSVNCSAGEVCSPEGTCVDPGWTQIYKTVCNELYFGTDHMCDCGCKGLRDPDCNSMYAGRYCGLFSNCDEETDTCVDGWACTNKSAFNDGTLCNCGTCGTTVVDPDCLDLLLNTDCPNNRVCFNNTCTYTRDWTCGIDAYNNHSACHCGCGQWDPDCATKPPLNCVGFGSVFSCAQNNASCIVAGCGNGYVDDVSLGEQCDGGVGCTSSCACGAGYNPTIPVSYDCLPNCNDGEKKPEEECDSTKFCRTDTCKCETGHPLNATYGLCSGCGNDFLDAGEECDNNTGCATDCTCLYGYQPASPLRKYCIPVVQTPSSDDPITPSSNSSGGGGGGNSGAIVAVAVIIPLLAVFVGAALFAFFLYRRHTTHEDRIELAEARKLVACSPDPIDFSHNGKDLCKVGEISECPFALTNRTEKRYTVEFKPRPSHKWELSFEPPTLTLEPHQENAAVTCQLKLLCTTVMSGVGVPMLAQGNEIGQLWVNAEGALSAMIDRDEIVLDRSLGSGSYATVHAATWRGTSVAVKVFREHLFDIKELARDVRRELDLCINLRHPNIIQYFGAAISKTTACIVMELATNGSLGNAIKEHKLTVAAKFRMALDVASGMLFLHTSHIIHRDLKPDNVLLMSFDPNAPVCAKLSDFGTSRAIGSNDEERTYTKGVGTPLFCAPEVLDGKKYSSAADVFSFSMLLWNLFSGCLPYTDVEGTYTVIKMVLEGHRPPMLDSIPLPIRPVIEATWKPRAEERAEFAAIVPELKRIIQMGN